MEGHGKRNLIILGVGAILITVVTTGFSLWFYRSSGDIYLDRSRPGYLPDEEEAIDDSNANTSFIFSDTGELKKEDLNKYLEELKKINDRIHALKDPYSPSPLSDESLGIVPNNDPNPDIIEE